MGEFILQVISWFSDTIKLFLDIQVDTFMGKPITFSSLLMFIVALAIVVALLIVGSKDVSFRNKSNNNEK